MDTPSSNHSSYEEVDLNTTIHQPSQQDVAIIGLSCRTAGTNTPEELWNLLVSKKHASGVIPASRWEPWLQDPRNSKTLKDIIRKGYFLDDLSGFDASFFGISPKEAELMDPHQRHALELVWEALENSGLDPKSLAGSDTAVYMGVDSDDYSRMLLEDLPNIEAWTGIGTAYHGIPNRISYHLDLQGPSAAVDAACASSLIAIHLARQAIATGESTVAICGGVNVICAPGLTHMLQKAGALSPEGVCRSFDDKACGYARGEGGAIVILKQLSAAIADGDNILALLKSSASAQDGKTNGIMAPNAQAQELVARQALLRAGYLDPLTVGYVEAHATSTSIGDPTEISAIAKVYGVGRSKSNPCFIGSIKPNVGHLEAAAGAIGFVKAVLAVSKAQLAPQVLLDTLNTKIDWAGSGLEVVRETTTWSRTESPRRAAVCCYGYGGSVCHAIIEEATLREVVEGSREPQSEQEEMVTIVLSAHQEKRLAIHATSVANWLSGAGKSEDLRAIARTLSQRRAAHDYRAAFVVTDHDEAVEALTKFANSKSNQWTSNSRVFDSKSARNVVWVFSGHGAQWPEMGKQLLRIVVFRQTIEPLDKIVSHEMKFSPIELLERGELGGSDRIQVLTYIVQVGLSEVLRAKGIQPRAIIGHSVGEIAAAVAAGCLSAKEGAVVVSRRAALYAEVKGRGAMALISLPFASVAEELGSRSDIVASIKSSPNSCVVSGETTSVDEYVRLVEGRQVKTWRVQTDIAFHSPMLGDLAAPLQKSLERSIVPKPASVPLYSTSHTDSRTAVLRDGEYWAQNMLRPVHLVEAVDAATDDGHRIFVEISSHPIVSHSVSETLAARSVTESAAFGVMRRNTSVVRTILHAVSRLHTLGAHVNFQAQLGVSPWSTIVPNSPWVHKSYWKNIQTRSTNSVQNHNVDMHTLLGGTMEVAGVGAKIWGTILDETTKPYPLTHPLDGTEIIPAAVYCNTFLKAAEAAVLCELKLHIPLPMTTDKREVQVIIQGNQIYMHSRLKNESNTHDVEHSWIKHSTATLKSSDMVCHQRNFCISEIKAKIGTQLPNNFAWDYLQKIGVSGIAFPWSVLEHFGNGTEMLVKLDMYPNSQTVNWDEDSWAPFLDAATSVGSSIFFNSVRMRIVSGIDRVSVSKGVPPKIGWLYIEQASSAENLKANISVLNERGSLLAELKGMHFSDIEATHERSAGLDTLVHHMAWVPPMFSETARPIANAVVICNDEQLRAVFVKAIRPDIQDVTSVKSSEDLGEPDVLSSLEKKDTIVVYIPGTVVRLEDVAMRSHTFVWETASILKILVAISNPPTMFVVTNNVQGGQSPTALSQAPLHGFARIAASEYPDSWGGLVDTEEPVFPALAIKYVQNQSVIRILDGLPRIPRLRPFTESHRHNNPSKSIMPKRHGTYLITGGFGDLGLETLDFLVNKGARRIVIVSRRRLPTRIHWATAEGQLGQIIHRIQNLEALGATFYAIALDIGSPSAALELTAHLEALDLPPVLGVVHAAGISGYGFIKDTASQSYADVMQPKIQGALNLHTVFPPNTLDFFVLFSSIGQLIGTAGQAAYASSNAFLDSLATHRRSQGCNSISIQWTAWRGMGLASDVELVELELKSKGVTDITVEEGLQAWEHLSQYDTDHSVVTRTIRIEANEKPPCALIADIVQRRPRSVSTSGPANGSIPMSKQKTGSELKADLGLRIRQCLSAVLDLDVEDIDDRAAIADMGIDSIMTVALRQELQKTMGVTVPPTLTWSHPTVGHLKEWFYKKLAE